MKKHITFLLLFTFLFTACAERGYKPKPVVQKAVQTTKPVTQDMNIKRSNDKDGKKVSITINKKETPTVKKEHLNNAIVATPVVNKIVKKETSIFSLSHEEKKTISGVFIFIIGLIILL